MLKLEQTEALTTSPSTEAISDIPEVIDEKTKLLREAIVVVFSRTILWLTEKDKVKLYKDFTLSKMGLVIFTDNVSAGTKKTPNIISDVQEAFETLMLTEKD